MSGAWQIVIQSAKSHIVKVFYITLAASISLSANPLQALTLSEYVSNAVQNDPRVLEQVHIYRQVYQDEKIALSGWRPSIDLQASFGQFSRTAPNTGQSRRNFDSQQGDVTISQNLFAGFETTNSIGQARARLSAAAFQIYDTADNIALSAAQAYLRAVTEVRLVNLAAQNVASHQLILSQLRELSERGITRRSDLEQTEGRLARAQASLIAEQNNLEDALTQLHTLLGRYVSPSDLAEPENPEPVRDMALNPLIEEALRAHPGIESARNNVAAAHFDYKRSRSTNLPSLDLALRSSVANDINGTPGRTEDSSIVLSLQYNLYRGGADQADQRKKISVMHESKAFLERVRRQVIDTLRLAWSADRALQGQLPYLDRHSRKSLETVELYREEYLLQKRDLIDLLDAEGELNGALSSHVSAFYDSIAARYRVYEGLGALFGALSMSAEINDDDLHIGQLSAAGVDSPELNGDRDGDGIADDLDQCGNSQPGQSIPDVGCAQQPKVILGMSGVDLTFIAIDDHFSSPLGTALSFSVQDLLANDQIRAVDRPEVRAYTQAGHGAVTSDGQSTLTYTPATGFSGEDSFEYTVGDQRGRRSTATVHVQVASSAAEQVEVIYFDSKKESLTESSRVRLGAVAARLTRNRAARVEIHAYTDNVGSAPYNQRLSERRARAVQQMFTSRGIEARRIKALGEGENRPIASNETEQGRAQNRRVELRFVDAGNN
ncbi:MAG: adhesin transport system outer membrane protein [Gammaproteobacteria bacterium]